MTPQADPSLHIAILAPGEVFGGAERQILTLLTYLRTQLSCVKLVLFHDTDLAVRARDAGAEVEILGVRGLWDPQALQRLVKIIRDNAIQVVHVHGYRAAAYAALARRQHAFATVKTEHGAVEVHDGLSVRNLRSYLYRFIENRANQSLQADLVYVTKDLQQRCAQEHQGMSGHVIYNGVDSLPAAAAPPPAEMPPSFRHLLLIGRLEPVKGMETAIRALAFDTVPDDVMLHIIGAGPLQSSLESLIHDLDLGRRVQLLGFRNNVYDYLAHADALLIPSLHEGLPYTLLEAMELGIPVIASRVGGLGEVLSDRVSALLIPPQNPAKLAEAIRELLSNDTLAKTLRETGRILTTKQFSARNMGESYLKLFREAAARSTRM